MLAAIQILFGGIKLAGLTLSQWSVIVAAVQQLIAQEPQIVAAAKPILDLLVPEVSKVFTAIVGHLGAGGSVSDVAQAAYGWHQQTQGEENDWMDRFGAGSQS